MCLQQEHPWQVGMGIGLQLPGEITSYSNTELEGLSEDTFTIRVKVVDQLGGESEEGTLKVSAPKAMGFHFNFNLFERIFEQYPFAFPILRNLLGL